MTALAEKEGTFWDRGEKRIIQIAGLSGILSVLVFISSVLLFGDEVPVVGEMGGLLNQLNQNSLHFVLLTAGYFIASLLQILFYLGLYSSLRKQSSAYAIIGGVMGVIAFSAFAAMAVLEASAFLNLTTLYSAATTPVDKAVYVSVANGAIAVLAGLDRVQLYFRAIALLFLGGAMLGGTIFGKRYGSITIVFGIIFISGYIPFFYAFEPIAYIALSIILGQKLLRMSRPKGVTH